MLVHRLRGIEFEDSLPSSATAKEAREAMAACHLALAAWKIRDLDPDPTP